MVKRIKILLSMPFLRFLLVGGMNTALCYLVYAAMLFLKLPFWLANFIALIFGIFWSYYTAGKLVFRHEGSSRLAQFIGSWLVIYVLQTGLIWLLTRAGIGAAVAGLIVLPGTAVASYIVQRFIVFRPAPQS